MENYHEAEVRKCLAAEFERSAMREISEPASAVSRIGNRYPFGSSKIDWKQVPDWVGRQEANTALQPARFREFFDEMHDCFRLTGPVIYVGDGLTDFVLEAAIDDMSRALRFLVETVPQHHYFLGPNCEWCICLTMEGDMDFGRARQLPR